LPAAVLIRAVEFLCAFYPEKLLVN